MHETDKFLLKYGIIGAIPCTLLATVLFGFPPISFILFAGLFTLYHAQQHYI